MAPAYLSELRIPEKANSRQSILISVTSLAVGGLTKPKRAQDAKFGEFQVLKPEINSHKS